MKSTYYKYLQSLTKEQLIETIYTPFEKHLSYPGITRRRIALRISYDGKRFKGVQPHRNLRSIHDCLVNAMELAEIIPENSQLVFCGRTDAGVSAISMVASVDINSRLEDPNRTFKILDSDYNEYPYDVILNRSLPEEVRITGWAPATDDFNARYHCVERRYRYFFVLNDLDLNMMNEAVDLIRNMDNFYDLSTHSNPKAVYKRKLNYIGIKKWSTPSLVVDASKDTSLDLREDNSIGQAIDVKQITTILNRGESKNVDQEAFNLKRKDTIQIQDDLYCLEIAAHGFLHNMVRKIFWVIKTAGKGKGIILKNVEIADPEPLVFVGAKFKQPLNFLGNKYNEILFKKEEELSRIKMAISQLRFSQYDSNE